MKTKQYINRFSTRHFLVLFSSIFTAFIGMYLFLSVIPTLKPVSAAVLTCQIPAGRYAAVVTTNGGSMRVNYSCRNGRTGSVSHSIPSLAVPIDFYLNRTVNATAGVRGVSRALRLDQLCQSRGRQCTRICQVFDCSRTYITFSAQGKLSCSNNKVALKIDPNGISANASIALNMQAVQCTGTGTMTTGGTAVLLPR